MTAIDIKIADLPVPTGRMVKVVTFVGSLDESNVDEHSKIIYDMLETLAQAAVVIFDFAQLDYMNSKSIGYLTDWYLKISDEKGGMLVLTQATPGLLDVLDTVGLLQIVRNFPTMDEAVAFAST